MNKLASIIILTYNSGNDIDDCIRSILNQTYKNIEIIAVDNASTDNTVKLLKSQYPEVNVIETGANLGYAAGNNVGIEKAKGDYIIVINPDTVTDPDWLSELLKPFETNPDVSITVSKILLFDKKELINTCANHTHFTGLDFCRGLNEPASEYQHYEYVGTISGCSFAMRREAIKKINGFDPDFFLYMEDVDISWRARLEGFKIMFVPTSIIYHKYKLSMAPWKEFFMERNRYIMLLKNYRVKTLCLILPALIVTETITMSYATLSGIPYIRSKLQAYCWVLLNANRIMEKRNEIQLSRKINDREFMDMLEYKIPFEQVIRNQVLLFILCNTYNPFFKAYFKIVKNIV